MSIVRQLSQYSKDLFVETEGLWRIGGFAKQGLHGLYLPQNFVDGQHLREAFSEALQHFYWDGISRLVNQPAPAYATGLGNLAFAYRRSKVPYSYSKSKVHRDIQKLVRKSERKARSSKSPNTPGYNFGHRQRPKKGRMRKILVVAFGLPALGGLILGGFYLHTASTSKFAPTVKGDSALKETLQAKNTKMPWTVPREQGLAIYGSLHPDSTYENAFVTDLPFIGEKGSLETVVTFSENQVPHFVILDSTGKRITEGSSGTPLGNNYEVYPVGNYEVSYRYKRHEHSYALFTVTNYPKRSTGSSHDLKSFQGFGLQLQNKFHGDNIRGFLGKELYGVVGEIFGKELSVESKTFFPSSREFYYLVTSYSDYTGRRGAGAQYVKFVSGINYGRHVYVSNDEGGPEITVVNWLSDGTYSSPAFTRPSPKKVDSNSETVFDEPFAILRYRAKGADFIDVTNNEDVRSELTRLFLTESLSREDLNAIKATATINELKQQVKLAHTLSTELSLLNGIYAGNSRANPVYVQDIRDKLKKDFGEKPSRLGGVVDLNTLNAAVGIAEKVEAKGPELYVALADAASQRKDLVKEASSILGVKRETAAGIVKIMPVFAINQETRRVEPLELTLYEEKGEIKGVLPYSKDVVIIINPETQQLALKHGIYLGRDNRLGLDINFTTTAKDLEARRLPQTSVTFVDDTRVLERTGGLYKQAQDGTLTPYEFLRETNGIRRDLGIVPSVDQAIRDLRTVANVVKVLSEGGKPEDLINTFTGNPKERNEFNNYLNFLGAVLAGETPSIPR